MSYQKWIDTHAQKHKKIVQKLLQNGMSEDDIIDYFDFENMRKEEPDFCPLYAKNKKCHDMESLNCYLCACPNFRYNDAGIATIDDKIQYSYCSIESKDGRQGIYGAKIHQDCSRCTVPHTKSYVKAHFNHEWSAIFANSFAAK